MRQFRATSLGEFAVPLFIFAPIGTLFLGLVLSAMPSPAQAVDWVGGSDDWNTPANWDPADVPASLGETATFNALGSTTPRLSNAVTIASIIFNEGANAYTIVNPGPFPSFPFFLQGAGIINNSGVAQTINNSSLQLQFFGNSTAGNATINNSGILGFSQNSTAGNATINNSLISVFLGNSTAGNATINNFFNLTFSDSTAGNATINNNGQGAFTQFSASSTAGSATINNNGQGAFTQFSGSSTAGSATITNSGNNSFTEFILGSSGGNAALVNADPTAFITIAGLNSAGTTVGSIAGNGTIFLGSKNLTVGGNQQSTLFSGVISDGQAPGRPGAGPFTGGSLTKVGNGTLKLTGLNTYTGGTSLNGGVLAVNSDSNLGMGPLSFNGGTLEALGSGGGITSSKPVSLAAGGGTFLADAGTASTLSGAITGVGAWTKAGPGTLALSGTNTYSGGTTIAGGTLLTQSASALGTGPVTLGNGTTLQVQNLLNANGNWTVFPGAATVGGDTVQTFGDFNLGGGGTLIANASFSVPGAAQINRSGLVVNNQFTIGGDLGLNGSEAIINGMLNVSGTANVNSSGLVVNNQFTVGGNLDLNGSSEAIVNGVLTSPIVNVNNVSSLIVNNPGTVAANVNVGPSALLALFGAINGNVTNAGIVQGTGVANGNVINSGLVSPGTSIGKLTVNGNYTQNPNGTLRIEVAGLAPSQHDVLAVNGHASVAGTVQLVRVGGFNLRPRDQITFLTATSGVSGTFGNVENDFLATGFIVVFDVVYLPNAIVLKGTQGSFAEFARAFIGTPNSVAVGQALDSAVGELPQATESELIDFLNNQTLTDLFNDIDLISPEELTSIFVIGVSLANVQTANLERRMDDIRRGSTGFSSSGFAINGSGPSFSEGFAGVSGPEGKSGPPVFAPIPQNRWGVFVTGIGEFTDVDSTFNASGYDLATGGFTTGIDYRIGSHFAIGLTGGYAYTHADLVNDGSVAVNGGKLGLYATAFGSGFYLDTAVIGGLNGYDTRRTALQGTASGDTVGGDLNVLVAAGYDWKKGGLSIGPTASFQYTLVGFGDFTESGSLAPLAYPSQHAESFRTAFGMKASYDWKIGPIHLIPEVRLAWQHEFGDTEYSLVSSFANRAGNSFTVNGAEIGRDSMLLGAGFAIYWNDRISTYAYYDGELFRTNYLSNNVSAGFRVNF